MKYSIYLVINGSIIVDERLLRLREEENVIYLAIIIAFYVFINWLQEVQVAEAFQTILPPHIDLLFWIIKDKSFTQRQAGKSSIRYPF